MTRFIFITGGVVSSLGKGLASAALASVLQTRGFKVRLRQGTLQIKKYGAYCIIF